MNKKIVQINIVCGVGSTGRIASELSEILNENGVENYIAYGYGKTNIKNSIKIGSKVKYYIHNILSRLTGLQGRFSYFSTKRFLKRLDSIKPDIIHLHNIHGNYINYSLLFKYIEKNNIPIIWTLHDCWSYTGKCVHYDYVKCEKWKTNCKKCNQLRNYPTSYLFDFSKSEYARKKRMFTNVKDMQIVTPSNWLAKQVEESYLSKYSIKVIHNGIDLEQFKKQNSKFRFKYNIDKKFIVLGVASDWSQRKGMDAFVELSRMLDENYKIVMVGLSKKQKEVIPKNIIKIDKTNSIQELAEIYSAADVFVNLTLEENFPTTNMESLACGTPVITYDTGGSSESLSNKCGIYKQ